MRFGFWNVPTERSVGHTAEAEVLLAEVLLAEVLLVEILLVEILLVEILLDDVLLDDVVTGAARVGVDVVGVGVGIADEEEEGGFPRAVQPNPTLMVMISQP
jgi:hypothetical protein